MLLSSVRANKNTPFLFSPASFPHPREIRAGHGGPDAKAGARRHPQPAGEPLQGAGGPSTLALPTPASPLPRPCLRRARPGPPGLRGPPVPVLTAWRPLPRRPPPRAASHAALPPPPRRESTWEAAPAQSAPPPPLRLGSARAWRTETASLPPPYCGSETRIPGGRPLTSGPARRCLRLRLRRALTSDSRCERRPYSPRELPPLGSPRPRPRAWTRLLRSGTRPWAGHGRAARAVDVAVSGLAEASWSRHRETIVLQSFGGSSLRGLQTAPGKGLLHVYVLQRMDALLSPETLYWRAVALAKKRREFWINPCLCNFTGYCMFCFVFKSFIMSWKVQTLKLACQEGEN